MTNEKKSVIIVCDDKKVLELLSYKYDFKKVLSIKEYKDSLMKSVEEGRHYEGETADLIVFGNEVSDDVKNRLNSKEIIRQKSLRPYYELFYLSSDLRYRKEPPKYIGFGNGSLMLSLLSGVRLLFDITNHENVVHLTNFIMPDGNILEYDVESNHTNIIIPSNGINFNILAFSTFNNSFSYTDLEGQSFKTQRDFIEIEAIKFETRNIYCFFYEVPKKGNNVLIDLTLQLTNR